jgi:hypothetical protein
MRLHPLAAISIFDPFKQKIIIMNTRILGLLGILGSPFLAIQLNMYGIFEYSNATSLGNVFGLIYMTGWFCSILGLYKLNAAGNKSGKKILIIQMVLLTIGNLWNIYSIIDPTCDTIVYHIADAIGWPLDNIFHARNRDSSSFCKTTPGLEAIRAFVCRSMVPGNISRYTHYVRQRRYGTFHHWFIFDNWLVALRSCRVHKLKRRTWQFCSCRLFLELIKPVQTFFT